MGDMEMETGQFGVQQVSQFQARPVMRPGDVSVPRPEDGEGGCQLAGGEREAEEEDGKYFRILEKYFRSENNIRRDLSRGEGQHGAGRLPPRPPPRLHHHLRAPRLRSLSR